MAGNTWAWQNWEPSSSRSSSRCCSSQLGDWDQATGPGSPLPLEWRGVRTGPTSESRRVWQGPWQGARCCECTNGGLNLKKGKLENLGGSGPAQDACERDPCLGKRGGVLFPGAALRTPLPSSPRGHSHHLVWVRLSLSPCTPPPLVSVPEKHLTSWISYAQINVDFLPHPQKFLIQDLPNIKMNAHLLNAHAHSLPSVIVVHNA